MGLKAVFIITVSTLRMIFPGIEPVVNLHGNEPSQSVPVTKSVTIGLFSNQATSADAYAWVKVPQGLGIGERADMQIDRTLSARRAKAAEKTESPAQVAQKTYWGCGDEIPQGQPRCDASAQTSQSKFTLPDKSLAYWPGHTQKPLSDSADAQGTYTLDTNLAEGASITLAPNQTFLGAIHLVSDVDKFDLAKSMKIEWKPVPEVLGYLITVFGGTKDQSITWTSSSDPDASEGLDERAIGEEELKSLLDKGVLLAEKTTSCTIPSGIFAGATGAMITVTAFGHDKIQQTNGIETRVIVRSSASIMLMAKKVAEK